MYRPIIIFIDLYRPNGPGLHYLNLRVFMYIIISIAIPEVPYTCRSYYLLYSIRKDVSRVGLSYPLHMNSVIRKRNFDLK